MDTVSLVRRSPIRSIFIQYTCTPNLLLTILIVLNHLSDIKKFIVNLIDLTLLQYRRWKSLFPFDIEQLSGKQIIEIARTISVATRSGFQIRFHYLLQNAEFICHFAELLHCNDVLETLLRPPHFAAATL